MRLKSHSGSCFNFEGEGVTESKFQLQMQSRDTLKATMVYQEKCVSYVKDERERRGCFTCPSQRGVGRAWYCSIHKKVDQLVERRKKRVERTNYQSFFLFPLPLLVCLPTKNKGKGDQQTTDLMLSLHDFWTLTSQKKSLEKTTLRISKSLSHTQDKSFKKERPTREFLNGFNPPGLFYFIMHSF